MDKIVQEIQESIAVKAELARVAGREIAETADAITACLRSGRKVIAFGNGGSASDAQHFVAELVGRYKADREALAAVALTVNGSSLTAIANDYGFAEVFARQLAAIGKPGDLVLAISTSGNSPNILRALETAMQLGMRRIGLTGQSGGKLRSEVEICITVPSTSTPRIQECHALIIHILCGIVEEAFVTSAAQAHKKLSAGEVR
ncbi:MAG TPA: SIS domain-containing protein [Candidatus Acidoferrum sp.]|jgi:D-sedoheptulose 7-phosphate isomerase